MSEELLKIYGFNEDEFKQIQERYRSGRLSLRSNVINYGNSWEVRLPHPEDAADFPSPESKAYRRGEEELASGRLGLILMNGGAATRFQKPGENIPKGAFEIMDLEGRPRSFMELKLAQARWAEANFKGQIPVWILNSYFTDEKTRAILEENNNFGKKLVFTYCQGIMKRVVPSPDDLRLHYGKSLRKLSRKISSLPSGSEQASLKEEREVLKRNLKEWLEESRRRAGEVIEAGKEEERYNPPGHLDATLWLILDRSRPLLRMLELGVEWLGISNIDNLGATVYPGLCGLLREREKAGFKILCEVSRKPPGQKGGALARVYDPERNREWSQIIEEFSFPPGFDQDRIPEFNNATYTISVATLLKMFELDREQLENLSREELVLKVKKITDLLPVYVAMKELKEVGGIRPVVQFERLQGDLTRLLKPLAVKTKNRFFPVKRREDIPIVVPRLKNILAGQVILSASAEDYPDSYRSG